LTSPVPAGAACPAARGGAIVKRATAATARAMGARRIFMKDLLMVLCLGYSHAEAAADARRQRVKLYSEYCEPFATTQMRPDRLARRVKTPVLVLRT
jgi:hypothetical protein